MRSVRRCALLYGISFLIGTDALRIAEKPRITAKAKPAYPYAALYQDEIQERYEGVGLFCDEGHLCAYTDFRNPVKREVAVSRARQMIREMLNVDPENVSIEEYISVIPNNKLKPPKA